jgi:hypothetical protein
MSWTRRKKNTSYRMLIDNPDGNRPFKNLRVNSQMIQKLK